MKELKVYQIHGKTAEIVQKELEKALDLTNCEDIMEMLEPFQHLNTWHAGFTYWEAQPRLRAVC